jgi:hypothetical protein
VSERERERERETAPLRRSARTWVLLPPAAPCRERKRVSEVRKRERARERESDRVREKEREHERKSK